MNRVLVTGATGFIGRESIPFLVRERYDVHGVHFGSSPDSELAGVTWHRTDLLNQSETIELIRDVRPTHLLHLAWRVTPQDYWTSPENVRWLESSVGLIQTFCENGGKRAVVAGTCAEYDWRHSPLSEASTPLLPSTLYGICKDSLRRRVGEISERTGLSTAWGRIFFLYGPHDPEERLVPSAIRSLLKCQAVPLRHPDHERDYLHVRDVAGAFVALLNTSVRGPVNVASGSPVVLRRIVEYLAARMGKRDFLVPAAEESGCDDQPPSIVADVGRLRSEVGWRPSIGLEAGLDETLEWFKGKYSRGHP